MRVLAALVGLSVLAACGVDGAPQAPSTKTPVATGTGVTISGDARFGVQTKL